MCFVLNNYNFSYYDWLKLKYHLIVILKICFAIYSVCEPYEKQMLPWLYDPKACHSENHYHLILIESPAIKETESCPCEWLYDIIFHAGDKDIFNNFKS